MADIKVDGKMGEGGGQVLRTALTLSMATGGSIVVSNIRAGRKKAGLLRQHLAAVRAAQAVSDADVEGDELGSTHLEFKPGKVRAGTYEFRIGSAGSSTLLMQTILPVLALTSTSSTVVVHGGTHNGMAPSVDFCELTLLPILARMGVHVESELLEHGFYPNGGGRWRVTIDPWSEPRALSLLQRGTLVSTHAVAKISNLQTHIAERELERVSKKLGWSANELLVEDVKSPGPGNILSLRCGFEHVSETFEAVGALGVTAERVAGRAIRDVKRYQRGDYAVGEYLADQLLLPMVIGAGGEFSTGGLSEHCRTNMALIDQFLQTSNFEVSQSGDPDRSTISIPNGLALAR